VPSVPINLQPRRSDNLFSAKPSAAEQAALNWHQRAGHTQPRTDQDCWCCCMACRVANPHLTEAKAAAVADIVHRVKESQRPVRVPDRRRDGI